MFTIRPGPWCCFFAKRSSWVAHFCWPPLIWLGRDTYIALIYENGILKILGITVLTLLLSYYFDLYEPQRISGRLGDLFSAAAGSQRSVLLFSVALSIVFPEYLYRPSCSYRRHLYPGYCPGYLATAYEWIIGLPVFRERVYVLGSGERARTVIETLARPARCRHGSCERSEQGEFSERLRTF